MKICPPACIEEDNFDAISMDKSQSELSVIPPAMLSSRCPFRISFRVAPVTMELEPKSKGIYDTIFTKWYAGLHRDHTAHQYDYSLKLDTKRVLNSAGQYYVIHRLIRSSVEGKLVEISGHCPHDDDPSPACNCSKDPAFTLAFRNSQTEVFRNYDKEVLEMEAEVLRRVAEAKRRLADLERRLAEAERDAELERRVAEPERSMSCKGLKRSISCKGF